MSACRTTIALAPKRPPAGLGDYQTYHWLGLIRLAWAINLFTPFFVKYVYLITSNVHVQIRIIFKQNTFALGNI